MNPDSQIWAWFVGPMILAIKSWIRTLSSLCLSFLIWKNKVINGDFIRLLKLNDIIFVSSLLFRQNHPLPLGLFCFVLLWCWGLNPLRDFLNHWWSYPFISFLWRSPKWTHFITVVSKVLKLRQGGWVILSLHVEKLDHH